MSLFSLSMQPVSLSVEASTNSILQDKLWELLKCYEVVFAECKGLPPLKDINRQIVLKAGTELVSMRP